MIFRSGSVSAGSLVGGILTGFPNQFDKIFLADFICFQHAGGTQLKKSARSPKAGTV